MAEETQTLSPMKKVMTWVGYATALIGLGGSLLGGLHWYAGRRADQAQLAAQMAVAKTQAQQGEYEASLHSYDAILKGHPLYAPALKDQADTAMSWSENFSVSGDDDDAIAKAAAPLLDEIIAVLEVALTRVQGSEAADVQAHLGLAHWLNRRVARRESGSTPQQNFRAALAIDPKNVYANALAAYWLLYNGGNVSKAMPYFKTAIDTGKAREYVRHLEILGLGQGQGHPGTHAELSRMLNDMRKGSERLQEERKEHILSYCCDPPFTPDEDYREFISAVPQDEMWQTYIWLDDVPQTGSGALPQQIKREYLQATLLEIAGKRAEALEKFRAIQQEIKGKSMSLEDSTDLTVERLSKN
jgi:tetratricopeptide (TPR) repeat protein